MTMRSIGGPLVELPIMIVEGTLALATANPAMDAASEQVHYIGQMYLQDGSGSKTISSAGGKIHWRTGTVTWATAGTTVRVGIQDLSTTTSPGQGDGTFDVYADLVQGVDTLTSSTITPTAMTNGTKTIAHGDLIAVAFNMSTRNGADSVITQSFAAGFSPISYQTPATMLGTPTFARQNSLPNIIVEFDDGTIGWIAMSCPILGGSTTLAFNVNTGVADEYGNVFTVPVPMTAAGITTTIQPTSVSADFELCLYSDPMNSPVLVGSAIAVDATQMGNGANNSGTAAYLFSTPQVLKPGITYAITVRPTTTNNVSICYTSVGASNQWQPFTLGDSCYAIARIDNSGAFTDYNGGTAKTRRINISLIVEAFNDRSGNATSLIGI